MAKPRTVLQLIERLDREFSWRKAEFHFIKTLVDRSRERDKVAAVRAAVPMIYAHWEGCVKNSACLYVEHLSAQGLYYSDVRVSFAGLRAHAKIQTIFDIKKKVFSPSIILEEIRLIDGERLNIDLRGFLSEIGNLTSDLFFQILELLGIDIKIYRPYAILIDESLLFHRNQIAHGERIAVDAARYFELHDEVIGIIGNFRSDIEESAINKRYLRTT